MTRKRKEDLKPSPESLDKTEPVNVKEDKRYSFVKEIIGKVQNDYADREGRDEKLLRWYKKRYGIRPPTKSFPFVGAANTHIFLVDEKIRRLKPNYINLAFTGEPIATFTPVGNTPLSVARNAEILMHWLLIYYMQQFPGISYFRALALTVDRMLERGIGIAKVMWDYRETNCTRVFVIENLPREIQMRIFDPLIDDIELTEIIDMFTELNPRDEDDKKQIKKLIKDFRAGEKVLRYKCTVQIYNGPRVVPIDDKDFIVPAYTTDLQSATRITHILHYTENDLRMMEDVGKFENVGKVLEGKKNARGKTVDLHRLTPMTTLEALKRTREGVGEYKTEDELFTIYEIYTYFDVDGDGIEEKVVIDIDTATQTVLRFIEFPYDHNKWPFIDFLYEYNDDRWASPRGIPELLDHYQTIVTNQENAKLDRMTLANSLQFKFKQNAVNLSNLRFIPGQGIGLRRMEDLEELHLANLDISFDTEMAKVRGLAESYIGQPDLDLGQFSKPSERRTAFEVSEMVNLGKQIFSFDARLFKDSLQRLYDQIFELWIQYGPDSVELQVTGGQEPITLSKLEIMGNFVIVPNGEITLLSRTLEEQRAFALLELAIKDQSGATDKYNAWENYLMKADPRASKRILNTRERYEQIQQMQIEAQAVEHERKLEVAGRSTPSMRLGQPVTGVFSGNNIKGGGGRIV